MRKSCIECGQLQGREFAPFCRCGGMVEVDYDLSTVELHDSSNPYVRFRDLLPIRALHERLPADARYTPVIHATRLGKYLGMQALYLKDETVLPTRSTKDRMADVSLAYLAEAGVRTFCTSSTGNSSTAYALAIKAHPEIHLILFTAERFVSRVQHADHAQVVHFGLIDASFVDAFEVAGIYAQQNGFVAERGFFNLGRREGLKLAFLEAVEQIPKPIDWYVQAVSSAMGVYGSYKGAKELLRLRRISRLPKLLCVQQESCAPMVRAFEENLEAVQPHHVVVRPHGIAEAILRGNPTRVYPLVRAIVLESGGDMVSVTENEIREARKMIEETEGLSPCFSASAAMAGIVKRVRQEKFPTAETVMLNLTGGDRGSKPPRNVVWLSKNGANWDRTEAAKGVCMPRRAEACEARFPRIRSDVR